MPPELLRTLITVCAVVTALIALVLSSSTITGLYNVFGNLPTFAVPNAPSITRDKMIRIVALQFNSTSRKLGSVDPALAAATHIPERQGDAHLQTPPWHSITLGYLVSRWAASGLGITLVLSRTWAYASARRPVRLAWYLRVALHAVPLAVLTVYCVRLLRSVQCQTSQDFVEMRWPAHHNSTCNITNDNNLIPISLRPVMFAVPDRVYNALSSGLLLGASDKASCAAVRMVPDADGTGEDNVIGSFSMLWYLFLAIGLGMFAETFTAALQGVRGLGLSPPLSLLELSFAFWQCEISLSNALESGRLSGIGGLPNKGEPSDSVTAEATLFMKGNAPVGFLVVALVSTLWQAVNNLRMVVGAQNTLRHVQAITANLMMMGIMVYHMFVFDHSPSSSGLFGFPIGVVVSTLPQLLLLAGMLICLAIRYMAIVLTAVNPTMFEGYIENEAQTEQAGDFWARMKLASRNMMGQPMLFPRVDNWERMDQFTVSLYSGMILFSRATDAVFLNEDQRINIPPQTWLEDERYRELGFVRRSLKLPGMADALGGPSTMSALPSRPLDPGLSSGYAREKNTRAKPPSPKSGGLMDLPVRILDISSPKLVIAAGYLMHSLGLAISVTAVCALRVTAWCGVRHPPTFLTALASLEKRRSCGALEAGSGKRSRARMPHQKWKGRIRETSSGDARKLLSLGDFSFRHRSNLDIEAIVRTGGILKVGEGFSISPSSEALQPLSEADVDRRLYQWWLKGGHWGDVDNSSDYVPPNSSDNGDSFPSSFSSCSSLSSHMSASGGGRDDQERLYTHIIGRADDDTDVSNCDDYDDSPPHSRDSNYMESFDDTPLGPAELARLLRPRSQNDREEARLLAAHLQSDRVLTRSRFRRLQLAEKRQILQRGGGNMELSMRRRQEKPTRHKDKDTGESGAEEDEAQEEFDEIEELRSSRTLEDEEELEALENLLLQKRRRMRLRRQPGEEKQGDGAETEVPRSSSSRNSFDNDVEATEKAPMCVVCLGAPRTIVLWPCRCLSLCDECRETLAQTEHSDCLCCRTKVVSFSRLYVP